MDDDCQDETIDSDYSKHRSPVFIYSEVKLLLSLIDKYKTILLNKSTSTAACIDKESAWNKITKDFNDRCIKQERSIHSLKMKWDNLKKQAKKITNNVLDDKYNELDDIVLQVVTMISEADNNTIVAQKQIDIGDINGMDQFNETQNTHNSLEIECDKNDDSDDNDADNSRIIKREHRSINFSPQENSLLLQCVRREKEFIFSKENTKEAVQLKNRAWHRVASQYNRLSPQKRSTKVLRTKFTNMKKIVKSVGVVDHIRNMRNKHKKLQEDTPKKIKSEIPSECKEHSDSEIIGEVLDNNLNMDENVNNDFNFVPDPLSTVLNSDSGIDTFNQLDNKEAVRLKIDLLNYKMETAKLERKRLENAMQSEAVENALKFRTARLNAVSASMKLPPNHPALAYTTEELPAQHYLDYNNT